MTKTLYIDDKEVIVHGRFIKTARLKSEYYEWIDDPKNFVSHLKSRCAGADLFTFLRKANARDLQYEFRCEPDSIAVLPITTYEEWWKKQINVKTRNMIRKAQKSGVQVRTAEFNDALIQGIKKIYDESPIRQGKPFKHYGKDLETLRESHVSYLEQSQFIGAFYGDELIGFVKLVHDDGMSHVMQIISKIRYRNMAPTNALVDKTVEICAQKKVPYLHYGIWSSRGLGDFKKHHAFERLDLQRYFVPLNLKGTMVLFLKLYRNPTEYIPENWLQYLADKRGQWNEFRMSRGMRTGKN
jgi:hypothetical protein